MKTNLIAMAALLLSGYAATAQKISAARVPAPVKQAFTSAYPQASAISWEKEEGNFEAGFKLKGQEHSALFTPAGKQLEFETPIPASALPAAASAYIKQHYKGAKIKETAKITKPGGEVVYEAELNGQDVLFDPSGKFIKVAKP